MQEVFQEIKAIGSINGDQEIRKRSHLIITLNLFKRDQRSDVVASQL
jgi:hypothetical protein